MRAALLALVLVGCAEEPKQEYATSYIPTRWAQPVLPDGGQSYLGLRGVERVYTACPKGFAKVCRDVCARWCGRQGMLVVVGTVWSDDECFMQLSGATAGKGGGFFSASNAYDAEAKCAYAWADFEERHARERWYKLTGVWQ